ncbi:MAG: 2Fe-2S iron-sulfur cluster binding domain-containing protein [Rhodobiaceae bacterium]|nr:2Fe-2S iron-sulfur cluster binding domain-containing protein [Rhodobiaceae bacterium]MCC0056032.1 2Fe-2S iron-sulfur cluster binding domain-containing protein [Rhodobiaceae bacterium]
MPRITFVASDGAVTEVDAECGTNLMMTALTHCIDGIDAECGGSLACGTCHVYVDDQGFGIEAAQAAEVELLATIFGERRECSRLSCQIIVTPLMDGIIVTIPARQG